VYQAARLVLSLVTAAVLGPATFGTWVMITLALQYSAFASLGFPNGAGREVPRRHGQGRPDLADRAEDVALTGTLLLGVLAAIAGFVLASALGNGASAFPIGGLLGIAIVAQQLMLLEQVLLRSRFRFTSAAIQLAVVGSVVLLVGLAALPAGVTGLTLALVVSFLAALGVGHVTLVRRPRLTWDRAEARSILDIGFPIMLAGLAFSMLTTLDRWLVLAFLGEVAFGVYGLVGIALSGLLVLSTVVAQQYYPRIAHAYGANRDPMELLAMAQRQSLIAATVVGVAIVPMIAAAWLLLPVVLPAYAAAAAPATFAMLGIFAYSAATGTANLLNSVGAQRDYLAIQLGAIAIDLVAAIALIRAGAGMAGVGAALFVGMGAYALMLRHRGRVVVRRLSRAWAEEGCHAESGS
jgi:O-antigen/teichoic acid export membrane protein